MSLNTVLTQLENEQLIRSASDEERAYLFKTGLSQQAAYNSLLTRNRRELHRCVAETYEKLYAGRLEEIAALLAEHYAEAGDDAKTFEYSNRAGHAAMRVYASAEAISHFTRAILASRQLDLAPVAHENAEESPLTDCYLHLGRALEMTGQFQKALENYEEMESIALRRNDRAMQLSALVALATIHSTATSSSDSAHAQTLSNLALALAREIGDRKTEARVLWNLQLLNTFHGDMSQAIEYAEQSLVISRELGMREQTALTLNDLSRPYLSLGHFDRARASMEEALVYFRETDNRPMLADCLGRFAALNMGLGQYDRVIEAAQAALQVSESIGNLWGQSFSRLFVGPVYFERGEVTRAIEAMRDCIRFAEQSGFLMPPARVRAELGHIYGILGQVRAGIEIAEQAFAFAQKYLPNFESNSCAVLARLYAQSGDLIQAEANLKKGYSMQRVDFAQQVGDLLPVADMTIALAKKDYPRVIKTADESGQKLEKVGFHIYRGEVLYLKGQALRALGQEEAARATFTDAKKTAEQIGSRWTMWQIHAALGERAQARSIVEFIAQNTPEELRGSFLNLPSVQEVL